MKMLLVFFLLLITEFSEGNVTESSTTEQATTEKHNSAKNCPRISYKIYDKFDGMYFVLT